MRIYVGTSGWYYSWNPRLTLDWYLKYSGLNTIELNASFYKFPFPNQVKSWANKTARINPEMRWSIKVNRFITHVFKFSERAFETWNKFQRLFKPLEKYIDFYLFQLPPYLSPQYFDRIQRFYYKINLHEKFALEWRNMDWFKDKWIKWAKELKLTLVSIDSPQHLTKIFNVNGIIYLRLHGRTEWYSHNYTVDELEDIAEKILSLNPSKIYVYLNNDHYMRENALTLLKLLRK